MKKVILICLSLIISQLVGFSQSVSVDNFVHKIKKANRGSEKTDLSIPGWLIRFGANFMDDKDDLNGIDIKLLGKKISHLRIVSIENQKNVPAEDYKTFFQDIKKEGFEDLMTVRDKDSDVRFMIREKKEIIREMVLVVNEKDANGDFVLINIEGKFTMDDINALMKDVKTDVSYKKGKNGSVKTVSSDN